VRVLAYTSPARGHLYPIVPIMAALGERGHRASVCTLADELAGLRALGIEGLAIDPVVERNQLRDWRERSPLRANLSVMRTFLERARDDAPDLARAIAREDPDVLLVDINSWGAAIVAEASGRPWAMYSPYLLPLPSRDAPPFGPGWSPPRGRLGALRDALVRPIGNSAVDRFAMPPINALRARHGLPALAHFVEMFAHPRLLLALTAEGFEYPHSDWPANVRMVGPVNWAPPAPTPPWLADMRDPLVLVTCSTEHQRDKRLMHVALEALPAAGLSVVASTAAHDPRQFAASPGSRVERFVSHEAILERAACVVCHGGMGITQKALAAGVPVVVVPFGRDQAETASRVEHAAAGVRLSPRRLSVERLMDAVRTAIGCRAGAQRVSRLYARAGGAQAAADAIEGLAASYAAIVIS
jgi:MGT family glycosyltransferase